MVAQTVSAQSLFMKECLQRCKVKSPSRRFLFLHVILHNTAFSLAAEVHHVGAAIESYAFKIAMSCSDAMKAFVPYVFYFSADGIHRYIEYEESVFF